MQSAPGHPGADVGSGAVCWFRTSATHVSRHRRHDVSRHRTTAGSLLDARPCRRPAWSSPPSSVEQRPVAEVAATLRRVTAPGSTSSWPATEPRARPRSSPARGAPRPHRARHRPRPSTLVLRLRKELPEAGHDAGADTIALAPGPPPRDHRVPGHHPPDPDPPRRGHPRAEEAPEVLLHPLRGRDAQRDLAVRLHPLPAHRHRRPSRHRRRDHHLARRLHPLRPARVRAPGRSPPRSSRPPSAKPQASTASPPPHSPTTAWSTPSASPASAAAAAATASSSNSATGTWSRRTPAPTTPPPAARSNASSRP